ncbi:MAG: ABC transporter permease [Phycisphaerales bacterium]
MHAILAMAIKDARVLARDRAGVFFTIFFPVIFAAVFGLVYSGMGGRRADVRIVAVDNAGTPESIALLRRLDDSEVLAVEVAESLDVARDLVRRGRRSAYVVVPEGYADMSGVLLTGRTPEIELGIDPSRTHERAMIEGLLSQAAFEQLGASMRDPDRMRSLVAAARERLRSAEGFSPMDRLGAEAMLTRIEELAGTIEELEGDGDGADPAPSPDASDDPSEPSANIPAASENVPDPAPAFSPVNIGVTEVVGEQASDWHASAFSVTFAQGVVWGLIGCAATFSMSIVTERAGGTLIRLRAAPLAPLHVLAGKGVACVATTLLVCVLLIVLGKAAFGLRVQQPLMLAAALLCAAIAFVGIMMVLAVVGKTPRAAGPIGYAVLLTMAIMGGGMMPHFMMPAWMQRVGMVSPVKWTVVAVENAVFRGATWGEQAVPLAVLVGIGVAGTALGSWVFARIRD